MKINLFASSETLLNRLDDLETFMENFPGSPLTPIFSREAEAIRDHLAKHG